MSYDQEQVNYADKELDEQLECLRSKLLGSQANLKEAETDINAGEEQIKSIEILIRQFNKIVEDYREAYPGLRTRQDNFDQVGRDEKKCLENILNEEEQKKVCCIVNIVSKERHDITKLENKIQGFFDALNGNCTKDKCKDCECDDGKRKELSEKQKALDEAKENYQLWIDPIKSIESRFKMLEAIKKEIDKEHTEGNHAYAYYLLTDSKASFYYYLNKIPRVVEPECLEKELKAAWNNYLQADKSFNTVDSEVKSLEMQKETSQAQLVEDEKSLETTIKRRLTNIADEDCTEEEIPKDTTEDKDKCTDDDSTQT